MSTDTRLSLGGNAGRLQLLLTLLFLPTKVLHEATHILFGLPWAAQVEIVHRPRVGLTRAKIYYFDETRPAIIRAGELAPTVVGGAVGLIVIGVWIMNGLALPATAFGWAQMALALIWWGHYSAPSLTDLRADGGGADDG